MRTRSLVLRTLGTRLASSADVYSVIEAQKVRSNDTRQKINANFINSLHNHDWILIPEVPVMKDVASILRVGFST